MLDLNSISPQTKRIDDFCRAENDARKKNLEDVNEWIREENEKRMREAEALKVSAVKSAQNDNRPACSPSQFCNFVRVHIDT